MPETPFEIRWPDGTPERCWSPSTIIHEHLAAGEQLSVDEFVGRARAGLAAASDRVRARYGFGCTASAAELERIEAAARRHAGQPGQVLVERVG